jgi:hypothetical protein
VVEQAHRRTKSILAQMLVLRGSHDFASEDEYQRWVREVIERAHNALLGEQLVEERGICARCRWSRCLHIPRSQSWSAAGARSG